MTRPKYFRLEEFLESSTALENKIKNYPSWEHIEHLNELAIFLDDLREAWGSAKTWHYANVDEGYTYDSMTKNEKGDVVTAIEGLIAELKSGKLSAEQENVRLRMLIHLVGDIHAPMHAGRLSDRGGNNVMVKFFDKDTKLHSLWDTPLVEAVHKWSYTEWERQLNHYCSAERKAEIAKGTPKDWLDESHKIATEIYSATPAKGRVSYDYIAYFTPTIEQRLLSGGLRLAQILNELYR